ncbi:IclR family transcriptional regulator [Polymorphum gilvum]|uniref:IclR family transcriptional regulator n=1 Tax=Polymorphum gilvum TaxID=991904 RepID=UPI001F56519F|nr:IclR family transcriptional regulator [Polymorphum gilvum]
MTRAIAILRQLAREDEPIGVNPLARALDLVPSTCLHILRVLQDEGLVAFDPDTKRYSIGLGILPLARSAIQRNAFTALVQPRLDELSAQFGVTSIATQLTDPGHMVVVALSHSTLPFRLQVDLGSRFPALISATGRCFAAFNRIGEKRLREEFDRLVWDHPPAYEDWLAQIEETRARGFAVDPGTYISGVTVTAVPLFDASGRMTRSIVAIGISERVQATGVQVLADAMLAMRDDIANMQIGMEN